MDSLRNDKRVFGRLANAALQYQLDVSQRCSASSRPVDIPGPLGVKLTEGQRVLSGSVALGECMIDALLYGVMSCPGAVDASHFPDGFASARECLWWKSSVWPSSCAYTFARVAIPLFHIESSVSTFC